MKPMATITIPKNLIKEKDLIVLPLKEYRQLLSIFKAIPKDQLWFWTKEWQKKERESEEDIRRGKIKGPFSSGEDLLKSLRSKR